ncbi:SEFIR domain-containing protein [Limnohabitans sp.]|jgi:hypothetical protein|uniref:SEFIR domain-containing protein n=1 Tax=Limnohabitans sp. TaxID=1907725 RepID=UPI0037BE62CF
MTPQPKLFVSYSWSSPEHEQWVIDLATELVNSGVDVVLDKWNLREGHDSIPFMEAMVTDPQIKKVILICDHTYAEKANGRAGGVGTETQIISAEVYAKQSQDKFVAVIAERDDDGNPFLPVYYKSRIYIDLSESERYASNFEKLVRWIFDKPLHVRPEMGRPPSYVVDSHTPTLGTSPLAKRVIDGFKNDRAFARGALAEYLSTFSEQLERLRPSTEENTEHDDRIHASIEASLSARNEFIEVISTVTQYTQADDVHRMHRFFESLIPYYHRKPEATQHYDTDFDGFKFIVHELFLYSLAILLRAERFDDATYLLAQPYYVPQNPERGKSATTSFTVFREYTKSLQIRNERLKLNRVSLRADLLEQRSRSSSIQFRHVMQADFVAFLRAELMHDNEYDRWWPETLMYAERQYGPFEIFARAQSKQYLARVMPLLGISNLASLQNRLAQYQNDRRLLPRWDYRSLNPAVLAGAEKLGTGA